MNTLFARLKKLLTDPVGFFDEVANEKGYQPALGILIGLMLFSVVMLLLSRFALVLAVVPRIASGAHSSTAFTIGLVIGIVLVVLILIPLMTFFGILIQHAWIKLWGGKGSFEDTFHLYVYSRVPSLLISWIPFVGLIGGLYGLALWVIGLQKLHKLSVVRIILMIAIPMVLLMGIVFAVLMLVASSQPQDMRSASVLQNSVLRSAP